LILPKELKAVLDGATASAPASSKQPKQLPFTPNSLAAIQDQLDLNSPLDAAIFACLTTTFYAIARLGELTVKAIRDYDPKKHVPRNGLSITTDHQGLVVTKFHLPSTKVSPIKGEIVYWAAVISHTFALLIRSSGCQIRSDPIHRSVPDPL